MERAFTLAVAVATVVLFLGALAIGWRIVSPARGDTIEPGAFAMPLLASTPWNLYTREVGRILNEPRKPIKQHKPTRKELQQWEYWKNKL